VILEEVETVSEENGNLYLYCVTFANGSQSFGRIGIGEYDEEVRTIARDGIGIAVSRSPQISFAEIPPEQTLRHLAAHQGVIEQVMKQSTVIPVKFGTYVDSMAEVLKILQDNRSQLVQALEKFNGKIELDVVASWPDLGPLFQEIAQEEPIQRMKAQIATLKSDLALQRKIKLGEQVKERLDERRKHLAQEILAVLREFAYDLAINDLKDDSMIVNVALLLDRSAEGHLDAKINELDKRFDGALNFRCVGPLPPYSFGTAEVKKIAPETLDAARRALGLPEAASFNEIKQAHRRLAQEFHPDNNRSDTAAEKLQEVATAFKVLEEYCHNVKHSFASGKSQGLAIVKIRKLSELRAAVTAASGGD